MERNVHIPRALFDSKAEFNPCQYHPFLQVMEWDEAEGKYRWNGKRSLLITDEVGVGKTYETGIILQELYKRGLRILIFCPVKLCDNWCREMQSFGLNFINYKTEKQLSRLTVLPYSAFFAKEFSEETEKAETARINKDLGDETLLSVGLDYDVLVLDEAHYIRNADGVYYKRIRELIERNEATASKLKIFLTGTPIFNTEEDFQNIKELLEFRQETAAITGTTQGVANLYDRELQVRECNTFFSEKEMEIFDFIDMGAYEQVTGFLKKLSASSFFSLKEWLNAGADVQKLVWQASLEEESIYGGTHENVTEVKFEFDELKQLCAGWSEEEDSKLCGLLRLLDELKKEDEAPAFKVVIFTCFIKTAEYLKKRLEGEYRVYSILGSTKAGEVKDIVSNFKNTEEPAIMICSEAAREGQNMQFCHYLVHYDYPYTPAAIGQRNGRIYRKGQKHQPAVYYMKTNYLVPIGRNGFYFDRSYDAHLFQNIVVRKADIINKGSAERGIVRVPILPEKRYYYLPGTETEWLEAEDNVVQLTKEIAVKDAIRERLLKEKSVFSPDESPVLSEEDSEKLWEMLGYRCNFLRKDGEMKVEKETPPKLTEACVTRVVEWFSKHYGANGEHNEGMDTDAVASPAERLKELIRELCSSEEWTKERISNENAEQYKKMLKDFLEKVHTAEGMDALGNDKTEIRGFETARLLELKGMADDGEGTV